MCQQKFIFAGCTHTTIHSMSCESDLACTKVIDRDIKISGLCPKCDEEKHECKGKKECSCNCFVCRLHLGGLISALTKIDPEKITAHNKVTGGFINIREGR
ncbi:hypothetical protein MBM_01483 [Drepanopeziza brunnea f. sp. 'multigermtubi' MB_m1]|uniref:Uncharacterized protein n=1 Tax=Marssonina brunnea f. sp. multigermtubi (strain MB_m1) TaxID=1072389 RepID=K1X6U1_MARBU|nr:uncharacterized protein MBM_01483 [Drepanopeziza brunnea f. sp. 'multigermtubi' MB_m1]EKD20801.1 hypothetical protein MBM_01483 [Drepanopeziza brunnea f. sp. 'multigermtubi' MB_m1]